MLENTTNHLAGEKSPYLRQHVNNPVDWYPWGPDAFARARDEDKPILLSIGYSTCHWCHVMAHESFSNETIAALMNRHFICIKLDREERPDLDKIYVTAVSAMTGSAGWPLNVFLTPDGHPFYGGTYFPPRALPGAPSWPDVLQTIADHWADPERKGRLVSSGNNVTATLQEHLTWTNAAGASNESLPHLALGRLRTAFDAENGGFGRAPKFPSPSLLQFIMAYQQLGKGNPPEGSTPTVRHMIVHTLDAMATGGIFDHLGGGFHRYATDATWHVPHFEKMLYDNGQLLSTYLQGYRMTGNEAYADVARRTADYILRDLRHPAGGFFSAEDADSRPTGASRKSEMKEGAYFTWRMAEIDALLGEDSAIFSHHFGLRPEGNAIYDPHHEFDGLNILHQVHSVAATADHFQRKPEEIDTLLKRGTESLLAARYQRPRPHRDEKILVSWNGLVISGFAQAYQTLGDKRYLDAARQASDFILDRLYDAPRGILYHSWCDGQCRVLGMADDYVFLAQAFLDLYASDYQVHWLTKAIQFTEAAVDRFYDADRGGFFMTGRDHDEALILRVKEDGDSVVPSASGVAAVNLLRLARLTGREDFQGMADRTIASGLARMQDHPEAAPYMLLAHLMGKSPLIQIAVAGKWDHPTTQAMIDTARQMATDGRALAWIENDAHRQRAAREMPFVERAVSREDRPTAYVCIDRSCRDPLQSVSALDALLANPAAP